MYLFDFFSKTFFCARHSRSISSMLGLMYSTKKFRKNSGHHNESNRLNDPQIHRLQFFGKKIDFYIRSYSGDFDIFYEVFWRKHYSLKQIETLGIKNIIDVGANVGFTSLFYHFDYPDAQIFAIEPSKSNYVILKKNTNEIKNIKCLHAAVFSENTELDFVESDYAYNSKINDGEQSYYTVRAFSVSKIMEIFKLDEIDLLKIDVEGAENIILSKNNQWLEKIKHIIVEIHKPYNIDALLKDISQFGFEQNPMFKVNDGLYLLSKKTTNKH